MLEWPLARILGLRWSSNECRRYHRFECTEVRSLELSVKILGGPRSPRIVPRGTTGHSSRPVPDSVLKTIGGNAWGWKTAQSDLLCILLTSQHKAHRVWGRQHLEIRSHFARELLTEWYSAIFVSHGLVRMNRKLHVVPFFAPGDYARYVLASGKKQKFSSAGSSPSTTDSFLSCREPHSNSDRDDLRVCLFPTSPELRTRSWFPPWPHIRARPCAFLQKVRIVFTQNSLAEVICMRPMNTVLAVSQSCSVTVSYSRCLENVLARRKKDCASLHEPEIHVMFSNFLPACQCA